MKILIILCIILILSIVAYICIGYYTDSDTAFILRFIIATLIGFTANQIKHEIKD